MSSIEILLVVLLCAAAFCYGLARLVMAAFRGFGTLLGIGGDHRGADARDPMLESPARQTRPRAQQASVACPASDCRRLNPSGARFCAQCGRRLSA